MSREEVTALMVKYFPKCPICGAGGEYEVSGVLKNYVQCKSCLAKWMSNDFINCKDLKTLLLWDADKEGKSRYLLKKKKPVNFWKFEFEPSKFLCPKCSTRLWWICPNCKKNVDLDSNCPKCGEEVPLRIKCPKCSSSLLNERGILSLLTEEKMKELPVETLKRFPTCKFCNKKIIFDPLYFPFGDGSVSCAKCLEDFVDAQSGICLGCMKPIEIHKDKITVIEENKVIHTSEDCLSLYSKRKEKEKAMEEVFQRIQFTPEEREYLEGTVKGTIEEGSRPDLEASTKPKLIRDILERAGVKIPETEILEMPVEDELLLNSCIETLIKKDLPTVGEAFERLLANPLFGGDLWGIKRELQRQRDTEANIRIAENGIHQLFIKYPKEVNRRLKDAGLYKLLDSISIKCLNCGEIIPKISKACPYCNKSPILAPIREDPLNILKLRYAKGEITKEQYEEMKKTLEKN